MRFRIDGTVDGSPEEALRAFHEKAASIGTRLPNVTDIEVVTHEPAFTHLRWSGTAPIPRAFARVLHADDLTWEDETVWDFTAHTVATKVHHLQHKRFQYNSLMRFEAADGGSEYTCEGEVRMEIALVGHMVERLFMTHLRDNLERFFEELDAELQATSTEKAKSPDPVVTTNDA